MNDPLSPPPEAPEPGQNNPGRQTPGSGAGVPNAQAAQASQEKVGWERSTLERLAFAALTEQRLARRWRNGVRLAWLGFLIVLAWLGFSQNGPPSDISAPHTAGGIL